MPIGKTCAIHTLAPVQHVGLYIVRGWKTYEGELLMFFHLYTCVLLVLNSWYKGLLFRNVYTERYSHHFFLSIIKTS